MVAASVNLALGQPRRANESPPTRRSRGWSVVVLGGPSPGADAGALDGDGDVELAEELALLAGHPQLRGVVGERLERDDRLGESLVVEVLEVDVHRFSLRCFADKENITTLA